MMIAGSVTIMIVMVAKNEPAAQKNVTPVGAVRF
jgi:hypothetical protein